MVVKKDVEGDGSDGWGWMEGGERGCGRVSWVDLGFGCRKMGREGKGRLMLDGWMGLLRCSGSGRETE